MGKVNTRMKYASHNDTIAIEEATPRILLGKISEISTQVTGASDMAYIAIDINTNKEIQFDSIVSLSR